jgi:molybdate transport system regulatory protein
VLDLFASLLNLLLHYGILVQEMPRKLKTAKLKQIRLRLRVLSGGNIALGPGKVELLEQIQLTGSITEAARHLDMSYMRAWTLIRMMNRCFKDPLVVSLRGGSAGGGAQLTETGRKALAIYQRMDADSLKAVDPLWQQLQKLLRS